MSSNPSVGSNLSAADPVFPSANWELLVEGSANGRKQFVEKATEHLKRCRHTLCKNEAVVTELFEEIPKFYDIVISGIKSCSKCLRTYYSIQANVRQDPPERISRRGVIERIQNELIELDVRRIASQVVESHQNERLVTLTLSEVLFYPQALPHEAVLLPLTELLTKLLEEGDLEFPGFPQGSFFFMFHQNDAIRQWATNAIEQGIAKLDSSNGGAYIPLSDMIFTVDFVVDWLVQVRATGCLSSPRLKILPQLVSVNSPEFWTSFFMLIDSLSEQDLHTIFPSVQDGGDDASNSSTDESVSITEKKRTGALDTILYLLPLIGKRGLCLQLLEVLLSRFDPPHAFWFKTKLMPVSVLKLITKDFEKAQSDEHRRRWFDLVESIGVTIQSAYRRDLLEPALVELFTFLSSVVQDSAAASDESKLEAAYIFARTISEWHRNPLSFQRGPSDGPEPSIALRSKWCPLLIRYIITQSPIITSMRRHFVGTVIREQLTNDAARIEKAVTELSNGLNKLLVKSMTRSNSGNLTGVHTVPDTVADPASLRIFYMKELWYNATACAQNLNDPVHGAIISAFRDLALLDLDYCGGLPLSQAPQEWQLAHQHLRNILSEFRSYQKIYFALTKDGKARLPVSAFSSSIFSLLALAPDISPEHSLISGSFKATLRSFSPLKEPNASIASILRRLLSGTEGVDLVRGLKTLFTNLALRSSARFSFFSWHWSCQYFLQLLTQPTDNFSLFREKLLIMETFELNALLPKAGAISSQLPDNAIVPFWETWWIFVRYTLRFGQEHSSAPHGKLESTMPVFFELLAVTFKHYCDKKTHLYIALTRHQHWHADLMRWQTSNASIRKKWLEAVIEIAKKLKDLDIALEPLLVNSLRAVLKDSSFGDSRIALASIVPADGIGNLGLTTPTADLPARFVVPVNPGRVQMKLPFAAVTSSSIGRSSSSSSQAISLVDDGDDDVDIVVEEYSTRNKSKMPAARNTQAPRSSNNAKLDFWFSLRDSADEVASSLLPKIEQRNIATLNLLSQANQLTARSENQRPSAPKRLVPAHNENKRRLPISIAAPPPPVVPKQPAGPPPKSMTAEDRLKQLELQRQEERSTSKRGTRVLLEGMDTKVFKENTEIASRRHRKLMAPSVDDLLRKIVTWSINTINSSSSPPDKELSPATISGIPLQFQDAEHYAEIFQPLLLMEFWGQLKQAVEEDSESQVTVKLNLFPAGAQSKGVFDTYIFGRSEHPLQINDLVVVTPSQSAASDKSSSTSSSAASVPQGQQLPHVLAKVEKMGSESKDYPASLHVKLKFYLPSEGSERIRMIKSILRSNKVPSYQIKRLANMATMLREYQALMRFMNMAKLSSNVFAQSILRPSAVKPPNSLLASNPILLRHFESGRNFNAEQLQAIREASTSTGYTLIQGPPGTGKTKTILALIATLLDEYRQPILVCAPSNAAVDEIVSRLLDGIPTVRRNPERMGDSDENYLSSPSSFKPRVVRVVLGQAATKKIRSDIEDVTLERLIQRKLDQEAREADNEKALAMEKELLQDMEDQNRPKDIPARSREVALPTRGPRTKQDERTRRKELKYSLIANAQVVCATLSTSGRKMIRENWFQSVIIDEAAQAVEISTIIPLTDRIRRCVMVGDPNQLPATVLSKEAKNLQYEQSLFGRMMKNGFPTRMLTTQYRMHPDIRAFPSEHFYEGRLLDGEQDRTRSWHKIPIFAPIVFFDLAKSSQKGGKSLSNPDEARFIAKLIQLLRDMFPANELNPNSDIRDSRSWEKQIGVITPYQEQRSILASQLSQFPAIDIGTVDGFQGREKDIIVLSTVRSHQNGIGFLADVRRLNVAMTRAMSSLWIVGNSVALSQNSHWKSLIDYVKTQEDRYHIVSDVDGFIKDWKSEGFTRETPGTPPRPSARVARVGSAPQASVKSETDISKKRKLDFPAPSAVVDLMDVDDDVAVPLPPKRAKTSESKLDIPHVMSVKPPVKPVLPQAAAPKPAAPKTTSATPSRAPASKSAVSRPSISPKSSAPPASVPRATAEPAQPRQRAEQPELPRQPPRVPKEPEYIPPPPPRKPLPNTQASAPALKAPPKAPVAAPKKAASNLLGSIIASMTDPSTTPKSPQ